jgi:uncharacterized cupredoxin-like copper-binding protein
MIKTCALPLMAVTLMAGLVPAIPAPAADRAANPPIVTVVMVDNRFQPDHVTFQQGQPYELRLENHGKEMHEFTAPAFFKAATIKDRHLMANGGTDVVVQPGQMVSIFLVAPPKGSYSLICADHDWDGMTGGIAVD